MKIVDIEMIELRVPGRTGGTFDGSYDNCLVLVHTDEGLSGIMEVDSVPPVIETPPRWRITRKSSRSVGTGGSTFPRTGPGVLDPGTVEKYPVG